MSRVAIFGLDGATFEIVRHGCERGELPTIARLLDRGAFGTLESTVPPITAAAWTTFQTGVLPGRHGILDWLVREEGSYRLRLVNSTRVRQKRLWDYAGDQGARVAVIGLPVTFPPRPVNGVLVSGPLTLAEEGYTYPAELAGELETQVGQFPCFPEHWRGRYELEAWLERLKRTIDLRERTTRHLLQKEAWDLLVLHFMETDSVQHQLWHLHDRVARPRYRLQAKGDPILAIYKVVDAAIGRLVDALPAGTTVLLVSDHGFGPLHWNVSLNLWLLEAGYLVLKARPASLLKRAAFRLGLTQERLFPWAEWLRILGKGAQMRHDELHDLMGTAFLSFEDVDWHRTRAYSYGNVGQVFLNRVGREPQGIVESADAAGLTSELAGALTKLVNPANGEPVLERIWRKEDLYRGGEALAQAPELLLAPRRGYMTLGATDFPAGRIVTPAFAGSGWHEPLGILIAAGEGIAHGEVAGARLVDMLPTVLHAMNLAVPPGLDGRAVEGLFDEDYLACHPIRFLPPEGGVESGVEGLEGEDWDAQLRRRLRGLGYL